MKMPLKWHIECLKNLKSSQDAAASDLERAQSRYEQIKNSVMFYESQIKKAIEEGRDGFDSERYMVKKLGKQP